MNAPLGQSGTVKHFLDLSDFDAVSLNRFIADARKRKQARAGFSRGQSDVDTPLDGKMLALIFDKPSTRTRISFDVGMQQLGGKTLMLTGSEMQLGRGETMADTARVLSRYVDAIMIRTLDQDMLHEMAENSSVPVINGMTKLSHPCQVLADVMTFEEMKGSIRGRTVAWTGDSNNVQASWVHAAVALGFELRIATPKELSPRESIRRYAEEHGAKVQFIDDPAKAVDGAECVVTDTWVSMGDEDTTKQRHNMLKHYQVNEQLMAHAAKDALFMHCLPAHRGEEVTDEIMDSAHSVVFDEAENRLHLQKAILVWALS